MRKSLILIDDSHPSIHTRLETLVQSISLLEIAIKADQHFLGKTATPLELMQLRAEPAEAALKASDAAIVAMKATIRANDDDAHHKQMAIDELNTVIEKNADNLKASAYALTAVQELAFNDPLTGLPNRRLLKDRLQQCFANNKRWQTHSAAIFLDLDKFKTLNDQFGHEVGDELLISVAKRLKFAIRDADTVARFGGDEFVVLLAQLSTDLSEARHEAQSIANKLLLALIPAHDLPVRRDALTNTSITYQNLASFGVVVFDGDETKEKHILDWADEAMYWAKNEGGRTIRFYDAMASTELTLKRLYDLATENDIETANHGIRMQQYVNVLTNRALQMNMYPGELSHKINQRICKATQLHDIGKTKIPYAILHKQSKLTDDEWAIMKTHTRCGAEILEEAKKQNESLTDFLNTAIDIAIGHHERWDGSGYPHGLAGCAIPLAGRIIAIADVYDALISRRSYKEPWLHEDALATLVASAGKQFDPLLIKALKREEKNFKLIAETVKD